MYKISYTGDAVQTEFPFAFPFFQNADVNVTIAGELAAADAGVYSVVPNEDFTGGTVVFAVAPDKDVHIEIFRRVALSRVIDYQPTAPIDPESLNSDFNFILAAIQDFRGVEMNLTEWELVHHRLMDLLEVTSQLVRDKMLDGAYGFCGNLLDVLASARPYLINDYGSVTEPAPNEVRDDYGIL